MSFKNNIVILAFALTAATSFAQKASKNVESLNLECRVSGKLILTGGESGDIPFNDPISVKIENGRFLIRDNGDMLSLDSEAYITDDEISTGFMWRKNERFYVEEITINRTTGAIRASKEMTYDDVKKGFLKASGNCEKVSGRKKF